MKISVYCGSKFGNNPAYHQQALALGQWIGQNQHTLVYGGATNGLMGVVADGVLNSGGQVIGVVPHDIKAFEDWHPGLTQQLEVDNLSQRKQIMAELAGAYIALPGGPGTLEEISEMISWARVKLHNKPCILFNIDGYYDHLAAYLQLMVDEAFIQAEDLSLVHVVRKIRDIAKILQA